jgi:hypothetical protein
MQFFVAIIGGSYDKCIVGFSDGTATYMDEYES